MSSTTSEEESIEFLRPYFTNIKLVGTGGSGAVYSAIDVKTDKRVALKRVNLLDQLSCKGALRQISVYKRLQHENIVTIEKIVGPDGQALDSSANFREFQYVFVVQELVEADLHKILQSNGTVSEDYLKLFIYQLLRGLKYIHSANVIHRDVKPSNILVDPENLLLKIGDFGLTRVLDPDYEHKGYMTHCPTTLWYRAPELILEPNTYSNAMDIWGVGCVFAELLLGRPLFEGRHELEQIRLILDTVGLEDKEFFKINSDISELVKSISDGPNSSLASKLPNLDTKALDLLEKMLTFSPKNRITAEDALAHPYLQSYALPSDEPISLQPLHIEDEVDDFPEDILKDMLYSECISWQNSEKSESMYNIIETEDSIEHDILSLKDIMNDDCDDHVMVDHIINDSVCEMTISSFKLHPELTESFGVQNTKETRDTLAAAMKVSMTLDEATNKIADTEQAKNFKSQQKAGISQVVETFLARDYQLNLGFSCKKTNAITGPFGLCYL